MVFEAVCTYRDARRNERDREVELMPVERTGEVRSLLPSKIHQNFTRA